MNMCMQKIDVVKQIRQLKEKLNNEPYGKERNGKTLPSNINMYARTVDNLIEKLIELYNLDREAITLHTIEAVQSIRANEVGQILASRSRIKHHQCVGLYIDDEMVKVSNSINMHISNI